MRRPRLGELALRLAVRDKEAWLGLLGDLHEEVERDPRRGRFDYNRAIWSLARTYALDRVWRGKVAAPGPADEGERWAHAATADVRAALRLLRRRPGYTAAVIGTLGLGFGAAAAVLSVAYGVWLKPLPFGDPASIVRVYEVKLDGDTGSIGGQAPLRPAALDVDISLRSRLSPPLLNDLRANDWSTLAQLASVSSLGADWRTEQETRRLSLARASRGVFEVLQLRPLAGRFFSEEPGTAEIVLSEGLWRRAFGGDAAIVGRQSMDLDGVPHLIVGVAPDALPYPDFSTEAWVPADFGDDDLSEGMRGARYLDVIARLQPGATLAAARAELDGFVRGLGADHPNHAGWGATAVSLRQDMIRPFLGILRILVVGAILFLAIACSNVAGLVAARRARGRDERGLRLALGASRGRLMRQEIAEMSCLALGGAVAAIVLASWALAPLQRLAPDDIPRIADIRLDPLVVGVLAATLFLAALAAAIAGNLLAAGPHRMVPGSRRTVASGTAGRATLIVVQVALTTLLLIGGAALTDHFLQLAAVERGFDPEGIMAAPLVVSEVAYPDDASRLLFFESILEALEGRGHTAALVVNPPVAGVTMRFGFRAGDREAEQHWGQYHVVSPHYFDVLGVPLVAGRTFDEGDRAGGAPVVMISETLAGEHFEGDPVGRQMIVVGTVREIVGVVGSVSHFGPDQAAPAEMYVPLQQDPWLLGHILVRPGDGFSPRDLREIVGAMDATVPVEAMFPYTHYLRTWFAPLRFQLGVVVLLAAAGTLLAVVGLYALIAYVVAGRTREIGIRVALGETAASVFARVVGRGLLLAGCGLALGVVAALALNGIVGSLGLGIAADDPRLLAVVGALVAVAAIGACALPARRAAAVDPVITLRQD